MESAIAETNPLVDARQSTLEYGSLCSRDRKSSLMIYARGYSRSASARRTAPPRRVDNSFLIQVANNLTTATIMARSYFFFRADFPSKLRDLVLQLLSLTKDADNWRERSTLNSSEYLLAAQITSPSCRLFSPSAVTIKILYCNVAKTHNIALITFWMDPTNVVARFNTYNSTDNSTESLHAFNDT